MRRPRRELMDDPGLPAEEHARALRGLRRINAVSGVVRTVWREVRRLAEPMDAASPGAFESESSGFRVLDVACGGGDVAVGLQLRALRETACVSVDGCDVSERALSLADALAKDSLPLQGAMNWVRWDALSGPMPRGGDGARYDVAVCTLFLHHLETEDAVTVLRAMDQGCSLGVVVLDLRRGWWPWVCTWLGVRLLSRSQVVHHDGPASVKAGWTRGELEGAARSAGLTDFAVSRCFPLRWKLVWSAGRVGKESG
ncbi:MAG: methyltransferase domain-containing protein [Planctomycetota bacterium]